MAIELKFGDKVWAIITSGPFTRVLHGEIYFSGRKRPDVHLVTKKGLQMKLGRGVRHDKATRTVNVDEVMNTRGTKFLSAMNVEILPPQKSKRRA